jgi:hypothetical protein
MAEEKHVLRDTPDGFRNHWERFDLTAEEAQRLTIWLVGHVCAAGKDVRIAFSFSSGIGRNTIVRCLGCDAGADITDYGAW